MSDTPPDPNPEAPTDTPAEAPPAPVAFDESGTLVLDGAPMPEITGQAHDDGTATIVSGTSTVTVPVGQVPYLAGLVRIYGVPGATPGT